MTEKKDYFGTVLGGIERKVTRRTREEKIKTGR